MIGRTIGKYRIVGQVGRGGAGIVYKAVDETLGREVAIKTLNPDFANTELMRRFRGEATILARLNHPHIATLYELFRAGDDLLMVMEFVRGETLDALAERVGPMSPDQAAYLIDRILSALEHAHRAGIVHRDMKPANVMVTDGGGVKIMDFGIARVRGAEQVTVDGRLMGTPAYMPPEQVLGQEVDGRADLYAVGVILYRLLTAALPFKAETAMAMMQRQILETPEPMQRHREGLPSWCEAIVSRALAKAPEARFQTAEEFREELRRATGVLTTSDFAIPIRPTSAEPPSVTPFDPAYPGTVVDRVPPRARLARWSAAVAAAVVVAALLGYAALHRASADAAASPLSAPEPDLPRTVAVADAAPVLPPEPVSSEPPRREATPRPPAPEPALVPPMRAEVQARTPEPPVAAAASSSSAAVSPPETAPPADAESEPTTRTSAPRREAEAPLVFEARALVGVTKPREHDAQLVLADGTITVTSDLESEYPFYSVPYESVVSITYSRGRDPLWNSPDGPAPVTRGGGTLGRFGIIVSRDWIALRTTTKDQFVTLRFDSVLVRRVLAALQERTGRKPELIAEPRDDQ
jgi:serine/threonine-protein kinase